MIKITSKDNSLIKHINKLNKSSKYRKQNNEFVAEGVRLCKDAVQSNAFISNLVICEDIIDKYIDVINEIEAGSEKTYVVSKSVFKDICETKTPQGVLCVIKALDKPTLFDKIKSGGKFVALDNIQDPSNLGTILRTAEALGVNGIILSEDCCDIYSPKVVRGSMGAVFRIPFITVKTIKEFISESNNLTSYASVVYDTADKITDIKFNSSSVLVIGNEGNGVKEDTVSVCDYTVTIPMNGRAESLNASAAAAILMWEMIK